MDDRKQFFVEPGSPVRLDKIDPAFKGSQEPHANAQAQIAEKAARMNRLQYLLYANGEQSLLVVLHALDAGGKNGVVRHLFSGMNPPAIRCIGFKQPTPLEAAHDFLWRAHAQVPAKDEVTIFNRSHKAKALKSALVRRQPRV